MSLIVVWTICCGWRSSTKRRTKLCFCYGRCRRPALQAFSDHIHVQRGGFSLRRLFKTSFLMSRWTRARVMTWRMKACTSRGRRIIIVADSRKEVTSLTTSENQDKNLGVVKMWNAIITTRVTSRNIARSLKLIKRKKKTRKHYYDQSRHGE